MKKNDKGKGMAKYCSMKVKCEYNLRDGMKPQQAT